MSQHETIQAETDSTEDVSDNSDNGDNGEFDLDQYRTTNGARTSEIDGSSDGHALKDALGESEHRAFEYDPKITGQRFAERYDDTGAAVREYLANAETACIRRARNGLVEETDRDMDDVAELGVRELFETASEEIGYEPVIEVMHSWPGSDLPALVVEDNGVGISVEEFLVLKKIGFSASHDDGSALGMFGQGVMSGYLLSGINGEFRFVTLSFLTDETYSERMRIDGFNDLDETRDRYGTTFTFPAFGEEARSLNVQDRIEEFSEGLYVPVIYREYDSSNEEIRNEDYLPKRMEDDLDESTPVVVVENEYIRAVSSPDTYQSGGYATTSRSPKTLLVSMPIDRNDGYSTSKYQSPWHFDLRLKREDGAICTGPNEGLIPIEDDKYENLDEDRKSRYIRLSEVNGADIAMPKPVDDRDRLESGNRDFLKHVSTLLKREFRDEFANVLVDIDDFEDVLDLEPQDQALFMRGYSNFGPKYSTSSADTIQEELEESTGVTLDESVCEKMSKMKSKVSWAERDTSFPQKASNRDQKKVWKVMSKAFPDGTVYMAKSISKKKAEIAWDLNPNNQVVSVDSYDEWADVFGWEKLKELPSRKLEEELGDQLSDHILDKYGTDSSDDSSSSSSSRSRRTYEAENRRIKVRVSTGRKSFTKKKAETVYDTLDGGKSISINYSSSVSELMLFRQTDDDTRASKYTQYCRNGVGKATVPNYVYDYLIEADNVYEGLDGLIEAHGEHELDTDWACQPWHQVRTFEEMDENDVIVVPSKRHTEVFEDRIDELREYVSDVIAEQDGIDWIRTITVAQTPELSDAWAVLDRRNEVDCPTIVTYGGSVSRRWKPIKTGRSDVDLWLDMELPSETWDRGANEWDHIFGNISRINEDSRQIVETMKQLTDDCGLDEPFVSQQGSDSADGEGDS